MNITTLMAVIGTWGEDCINSRNEKYIVAQVRCAGLVTTVEHYTRDRKDHWPTFVYTEEGINWLWHHYSQEEREPILQYLIKLCDLQPDVRKHYGDMKSFKDITFGVKMRMDDKS
tara:strand:- start:67313 stop:67657 length:345 start_codon:yes stop_codon:yes gene_type:complete